MQSRHVHSPKAARAYGHEAALEWRPDAYLTNLKPAACSTSGKLVER